MGIQPEGPQFLPPDPRGLVVGQAAVKYQRAAQVAADAIWALYERLYRRPLLAEALAGIVAAAVPAIVEEILNDEDIMYPGREE